MRHFYPSALLYQQELKSILLSVLLGARSLTPAEVRFTCVITGSLHTGCDILAVNPGPDTKTSSTTYSATKIDGSTKSWTYTATITGNTPRQRVWFGGGAGVAGAPLRKPKTSNKSCSEQKH